jgi:tetratricopeptide (TPR) repeat protein
MSQKNLLIKTANKLINKSDSKDTNKIEKIFESYLEKHPKEVDMWLRMAVFELCSPFSYYPKSLECINEILKIDPYNFEAILLFACVNHFHIPEYDMEVLEKLSNIKTDDPEKLSMIEYAKSWSYERIEEDNYKMLHGDLDGFYKSPENYKQYENALKKSIDLYAHHVFNYKKLACLYSRFNRIVEAESSVQLSSKLLKTAHKNIKIVYQENDGHKRDWTSAQEYFDELVKGIRTTGPHPGMK